MKKAALTTALVFGLQLLPVVTACGAYDDNAGTIDLSKMTVTGAGISVSDNKIEITQGGDFTVTGENDNAMIYVNAQDKVKLRLSGMKLKNETGPAIFFEQTEKALITVSEGTKNVLEDGADYGTIDAKAALFSNDDLEIKGNGTLSVTGNFKHGIATDDDLKIENGTLFITANVSDGLHANNTFSMTGGSLTITSVSDGIEAEDDVVIDGGTITVLKSEEGIESGSSITINGGDINIVSSDDGLNSGGGLQSQGGGERFPGGFDGQQPPEGFNGQRPQRPEGFGEQAPPQGFNGEMPPEPPDGFTVPEGMTPPDGGFMPPDMVPNDGVDRNLYLNGGTVTIDAEGDGVDSNGEIFMTGGTLIVNGPERGGDGAIDGSKFTVSGGTVIAVGSSQMAMGVTSGSAQNAFLVNLAETVEKDAVIALKDENGNELFTHTAIKPLSSVVYSSERLEQGKTYALTINGEEKQTIEMTQAQVTLGNRGGFGGGHGGFGSERPQKGDGTRPQGNRPTQQRPISVTLNGKPLQFDTEPIIQNDTTLVPLRTIFEALGLTVDWNEETQTVTATKDNLTITLVIGSTTAHKNGEAVSLFTAPVLSKEGRTLVPAWFIAESADYQVNWDAQTRTVSIEAGDDNGN